MSKDNAINIMNGSNLVDKSGVYNFFLLYIKMSECNSIESTDITHYQKNRDVILNRAKNYYENDKERLRGQTKINTETYLKNKKNKKKIEYGRNRYNNMSEEKKQKLKLYQKNYPEAKKSQYNGE